MTRSFSLFESHISSSVLYRRRAMVAARAHTAVTRTRALSAAPRLAGSTLAPLAMAAEGAGAAPVKKEEEDDYAALYGADAPYGPTASPAFAAPALTVVHTGRPKRRPPT